MNNETELEARKQRGLLIAQRSRIKKTDNGWRVPSQSKHIYYIVAYGRLDGKPTCTCPDYQERRDLCKHIFAARFATQTETDQNGNTTVTKTLSVTYPQDWTAYNQAQTKEKELFLELLNDLCNSIENPVYKFGRPKMALADMVFSSALKVYTTFSLRRFATDIREAKLKGYILKVPYYSTVARYMENPALTPVLLDLIEASSLPLKSIETDFAVDSSGFSTSRFGRWFDHRYGKEQEKRIWIKAHLMVGVKTNVVTAIKLTHGYSSDSNEFPDLVEATAENFQISEVSADKAYLSKENMLTVEKHGGEAFIPFKSNSSGRTQKSRIWKKMWHYFMYNHEEFLQHYHKRSNIETTFYMIKAKFGSHIRSKTETAQTNEVLLKILCHNICVLIQEMHELGIEPDFHVAKVNEVLHK